MKNCDALNSDIQISNFSNSNKNLCCLWCCLKVLLERVSSIFPLFFSVLLLLETTATSDSAETLSWFIVAGEISSQRQNLAGESLKYMFTFYKEKPPKKCLIFLFHVPVALSGFVRLSICSLRSQIKLLLLPISAESKLFTVSIYSS